MPELRWILLVLGALLIAGLWWWELKRSRAKDAPAPPEQEPSRSAERHEPRFGESEAGEGANAVELPSMRADDRPVPRGDPPVVTLDDLPEDVEQVVLAADGPDPRRLETISARRDVPGSVVPEAITIASTEPAASQAPPMRASRSESIPPAQIAAPTRPVVAPAVAERPMPVATPAAPAAPEPPTVAPARADADAGGPEARRPAPRPMPGRTASPAERREPPKTAPSEPPSPLQKIVALRLVSATGDRIDGGQLRAALEAEGMRFGKYSIFHRQRADGKTIYSAASLLEPGSFDLDRMEAERYPGISLFAVFPGPLDAAEAFDELLATARRLSDRLTAVPQDERGAALGAQRALAIREELVHFQGLVDKARARTGG